jgi:transcription elongation GreA/GreB family factor
MNTPMTEIRARLKSALHEARALQIRRLHTGDDDTAARAELVRLLGLLLVGASSRPEDLPADRAGYGSEVTIEDADSGEWFRHRLMAAEAMDLDAGHVTIDSPLGAALLGRRPGEVVEVKTPDGTRRVIVARVVTLPELLEGLLGRVERRRRSRGLRSARTEDRGTGTYG